jgi:cytochrome b involved in lipid metabolism/predicted small integral membrane protein
MDLITGLPIHPLINHGVVVLVPLAAIGALLVIFIPKLRTTYTPLVLVTLLLATISTFIATQSGEALSARVGLPNAHATQGERLSYVVLAFAILFTIWFALERSNRIKEVFASLLKKVLKVVIPIASISSFVLTVLVGHSGAEATWKDRIDQTQASALADTGPKVSNPAGTITLTSSEIKTHNLKSDCWSIVNSNVYNLTSYVQSHPGGASVIANICGKDGSKAFVNQHNTQGKPNNVLSSFLLGPVGASISAEVGQKVINPPAAGNGGESDEESDEESDDD